MEIRASEDAAHIENLEVENAKLRAAAKMALQALTEDRDVNTRAAAVADLREALKE